MAKKKTATRNSAPASSVRSGKAGNAGGAFLSALKKQGKTWSKARKVEGGSFGVPEIEDGTYQGRLTSAKLGVTKAKKGQDPQPWVNMSFVVLQGDYAGTRVRRSDFLTNEDEERQERNMENFFKTIQSLGFETAELKMEDLPDLIRDLNKDKPYVEIAISNWTSDKDNNKKGLNVYVNRELDKEEVKDLQAEDTDDQPEEGSEVEVEGGDEPEPAKSARRTTRSRGR